MDGERRRSCPRSSPTTKTFDECGCIWTFSFSNVCNGARVIRTYHAMTHELWLELPEPVRSWSMKTSSESGASVETTGAIVKNASMANDWVSGVRTCVCLRCTLSGVEYAKGED